MARFRLDDFDIGPQLGVGTVGSIYQVTHKETGQRYALKLLLPAVCQDATIVSRFEREILVLERLDHPNIVRYEGRGRLKKQLFYVMEFLDSGTLKELLANGQRLSWQEAAECGAQLAAALQHAHNHGIIHRDLKPGNVFLNADGDLKLGDFGIAKDLHSSELTDAGLTVGTYAYMCPELVKGDRYITGKVDLYAMGCVLFQALTGRTPYVGDNFAQIFEQHLHADAPSVRELGVDCPESFDDLIQQLLAKDPESRPFNARAVQGSLNEILGASEAALGNPADLAAATVRVGKVQLRHRIGSIGRRQVGWWQLLALVLFVMVMILAVMVAQLGNFSADRSTFLNNLSVNEIIQVPDGPTLALRPRASMLVSFQE